MTDVVPGEDNETIPQNEVTDKAISRAVGEELRLAREAAGWSRHYLVTRLLSGIDAPTLLSDKLRTQHRTLRRFIELCAAMGAAAPTQLDVALRVDLRHLLNDKNDKFLPLRKWAHNKLIDYPDAIVELPPSSVRELATSLGCSHQDLADYLATFIPEHPHDLGRDGQAAS